jgi:hypothetical protein
LDAYHDRQIPIAKKVVDAQDIVALRATGIAGGGDTRIRRHKGLQSCRGQQRIIAV